MTDGYGDERTSNGVTTDDRHVSDHEAAQAADPGVGAGTPDTAPLEAPESAGEWSAGLVPSRKWVAARMVAVAALLTMWATTGSWDVEETVALIGLVLEAGTSWLVTNDQTPGGVRGEFVD